MEKLSLSERLKTVLIKSPQDYIAEIIGPELHDGCNLSEDETDEHTYENNSLKASNSGTCRKEMGISICIIYIKSPHRSISSSKSNGDFV